MPVIQIARYTLAFSWLYHGIFPKLVHIAPLERLMISSLNLSEELSVLVTQLAGIGEVIFAVVFFIFYQNKNIIILNILGLTGLLLAVMMLQPPLLIEAFNPVTTNLPLIALSIILYNSIRND